MNVAVRVVLFVVAYFAVAVPVAVLFGKVAQAGDRQVWDGQL